jgi:catechol 2,3-dioxygenase-like lactoylglutathione lyase family enzyme
MADAPLIESIGQIHITVQDLPRSIAFYRDLLGLRLLFEVPGQQMAFFVCGGVRLYLGRAERDEFRSTPLIYYRVRAIQEAYQALRARGVRFDEPPHVVHRTADTELWLAGFRDPDGTHACLMSEVPPAGAAS